MTAKRRFWWGRIETAEHAAMITRRAAWGFGACAALIFLPQMEGFDLSSALFAAFIAGAALALYFAASVWAARALALVFGLIAALTAAGPIYWLMEQEPLGYVVLFGAFALPFALALVVALRAHAAAMVLRRQRRSGAGVVSS
jgi:hypothetical protein